MIKAERTSTPGSQATPQPGVFSRLPDPRNFPIKEVASAGVGLTLLCVGGMGFVAMAGVWATAQGLVKVTNWRPFSHRSA